MGQQIERLAQFVAETRWEDVPEPVRNHAKLVLLDTIGVILAGSAAARSRGAARANGGGGCNRQRRHGLRTRLARSRSAHRGAC